MSKTLYGIIRQKITYEGFLPNSYEKAFVEKITISAYHFRDLQIQNISHIICKKRKEHDGTNSYAVDIFPISKPIRLVREATDKEMNIKENHDKPDCYEANNEEFPQCIAGYQRCKHCFLSEKHPLEETKWRNE